MRAPVALRRDIVAPLGLALGVTAYATAVGYLTLNRPLAVLAALAAVALAITARNVAWLAVVAVAGVWFILRAPGLDVSYTDLFVAGAGVTAWTAGVHHTLPPGARLVLGSFAFFLGTLAVTLAYNRHLRSDLRVVPPDRAASQVPSFVGAWLVAGLHRTALSALAGRDRAMCRSLSWIEYLVRVRACFLLVQKTSSSSITATGTSSYCWPRRRVPVA